MARIQPWYVFACVAICSALAVSPVRAADRPEAGKWTITGKGNAGVKWSGTFSLERKGKEYSGTFKWKREGKDAGTESFKGTYHPDKRQIVLQGVSSTGQVQKARYTATVSADGKKMANGKWTGTTDGTEEKPGKWEATFGGK